MAVVAAVVVGAAAAAALAQPAIPQDGSKIDPGDGRLLGVGGRVRVLSFEVNDGL